MTLIGDAGIGKSRLVAEARAGAIDHRSAVDDGTDSGKRLETSGSGPSLGWVEGRWLSYTEGTAYYGWQELLRRLLDLPEACTMTACAVLEAHVRKLCPGQAEAITPYLTRLLFVARGPGDLDRSQPAGNSGAAAERDVQGCDRRPDMWRATCFAGDRVGGPPLGRWCIIGVARVRAGTDRSGADVGATSDATRASPRILASSRDRDAWLPAIVARIWRWTL